MTIVFVVDAFPSISETFILNQITGLIDLGHEVFIFSAARPRERDFHADIKKYELLKRTYYHNDRPANKIKRILWALVLVLWYAHRNPKAVINSLNIFKYGREALALTYFYKVMLFLGIGKIDIIFCHYGPNGNFAALMKEMGIKAKVITMFHGYDIRRGIVLGGQALYRPLFERGNGFLSICSYNHKHLVEFGAPIHKIYHHPVGINLQRYAYAKKSMPLQGGPVKILTVSRLVEEKGIAFGLHAIAHLVHVRGVTNVEYVIVGDGPLRGELEHLARDLRIKDKVRFLGSQKQTGVIDMLNATHIFLLPSIAEALPVVLMEAQACGLPIVATDVGSVSEVMQPNQSGFCVAAEDVNAMSERLAHLIAHEEIWQSMGEAGRAHVEHHYDINKLNQRLVDICQEVHE